MTLLTTLKARRDIAAGLAARSAEIDADCAARLAAIGGYAFQNEVNNPDRRLIRDEARRLATTRPKPGRKLRPSLRTSAGTQEIVHAAAVLLARIDELTARLDKAYASVDRDEIERERLLEAVEAAAHCTMDWNMDEMEGDSDSDSSLQVDCDDEDIAFAESASRQGSRNGRNAIRPSFAQAQALGLTAEGTSLDVAGMSPNADPSYERYIQNQQDEAARKAARLLLLGRGHVTTSLPATSGEKTGTFVLGRH